MLRLFLVIFLLNLEVITTVYKSAFISVLTYPITPAPISELIKRNRNATSINKYFSYRQP